MNITPGKKKNLIMLSLSLIFGGAGVFYSKQYIEGQIARYKNQFEQKEPMVQVVVPRRQLHRGEVVAATDLSVRDIPTKYADSNAITNQNYDVAVGQRVEFDVDQGRPLLWAHLER